MATIREKLVEETLPILIKEGRYNLCICCWLMDGLSCSQEDSPLREPPLLLPAGKFPPRQQQTKKKRQNIGNGSCQKSAVQPQLSRQQDSQGDQEETLTGQRNCQGLNWLSNTLKEGGGGQVQPIEEKGHHIKSEAMLRTVKIQLIIRNKQSCYLS